MRLHINDTGYELPALLQHELLDKAWMRLLESYETKLDETIKFGLKVFARKKVAELQIPLERGVDPTLALLEKILQLIQQELQDAELVVETEDDGTTIRTIGVKLSHQGESGR